MKFNIDIVESYLEAYEPLNRCPQSSVLHLNTIDLRVPSPDKANTVLAVLSASDITEALAPQLEHTYIVIANVADQATAQRLDALLPASCSAIYLTKNDKLVHVCADLLRMMSEINHWSERLLVGLAKNEPISTIFTYAQEIFENPLMLSDSSMCFSLIKGTLPDDFADALWTPAIQSGYCPLENYYALWHSSTDDPFGVNKAFIVQGKGSGAASDIPQLHSYLYRNIARDSHYYGSFELINTNRDFHAADLSFADYLGDVLTAALANHGYDQVAEASTHPLHDIMHERPIRQELPDFVLTRMGWDPHAEYHVTSFAQVGDLTNPDAARIQCRKRIESAYPKALIFDEPEGFCAIKLQQDFPIEASTCTSQDVARLFAPPYEIAMGASSSMTGFENLPSALRQSRFALDYAVRDMKQSQSLVAHLVRFDDCYFDAFVGSFTESDYKTLLSVSAVNTLIKSDAETQTEYITTLIAFFENGFNIHATAEMLHVHRNTLSYRLKRIKHLSGIDCESPKLSTVDPLRVYVACRAYRARCNNEKFTNPLDTLA